MPNTARIRELNDAFRKTFAGGRVLITTGVSARKDIAEIIERVRKFNDFNEDCDPFGEHDLVALRTADGEQVFAKVDYYNLDLTAGSPDPADESVTFRVLTLMMGFEY